jgi:hypothetical protein
MIVSSSQTSTLFAQGSGDGSAYPDPLDALIPAPLLPPRFPTLTPTPTPSRSEPPPPPLLSPRTHTPPGYPHVSRHLAAPPLAGFTSVPPTWPVTTHASETDDCSDASNSTTDISPSNLACPLPPIPHAGPSTWRRHYASPPGIGASVPLPLTFAHSAIVHPAITPTTHPSYRPAGAFEPRATQRITPDLASLPHTAMPPPTSTIPQALSRKRKLAPRDRSRDDSTSPDPSETSHDPRDDSEYAPSPAPRISALGPASGNGGSGSGAGGAAAAASSKRVAKAALGVAGKSSGAAGRPMSREALRKANHSLIERRRREKINAALADLRDMVPGLGDESGGKGGEFKLEVSVGVGCTGVGAPRCAASSSGSGEPDPWRAMTASVALRAVAHRHEALGIAGLQCT